MLCPNCGAPVNSEKCEYCGTRFAAGPEDGRPVQKVRAESAEGKECEPHNVQPAAEKELKKTPVFSRKCNQKTNVESPKDTFQLYESILQAASSVLPIFLGRVVVMDGMDDLGILWFITLCLWIFFWVYLVQGLQDIAEYCKVNYAKKCDARTLWKRYQDSPIDAVKWYRDQWLRLTVCFSGFLNNPADGTLIAGCASFNKGGTEFELFFTQKAGKEHLVPGQVIRVAGKCKGLQGERLRIEECFVLEVSER